MALISILISSQNSPLSCRSSYFDKNVGILLVTSSICILYRLVMSYQISKILDLALLFFLQGLYTAAVPNDLKKCWKLSGSR